MDSFVYLILDILLFIPWFILFAYRPLLRRQMIKASILGGIAGPIAELWFHTDYWLPPTVFNGPIAIEDILFGFVITGISVAIFEALFGCADARIAKTFGEKRKFGALFACGFASLFIFVTGVGFKSIIVSSIAFLAITAIMVYLHRELLKPALVSGICTTLIIIPMYIFLFNYVAPEYWHTHWLLTGTKYDVMIFGNVALTELLWYFSWGSMAGAGYLFASNKGVLKK